MYFESSLSLAVLCTFDAFQSQKRSVQGYPVGLDPCEGSAYFLACAMHVRILRSIHWFFVLYSKTLENCSLDCFENCTDRQTGDHIEYCTGY